MSSLGSHLAQHKCISLASLQPVSSDQLWMIGIWINTGDKEAVLSKDGIGEGERNNVADIWQCADSLYDRLCGNSVPGIQIHAQIRIMIGACIHRTNTQRVVGRLYCQEDGRGECQSEQS